MRVRKQPLPSLSNAQQQVPKLTCILQKRAAIFLQYQSTCQARKRWESIISWAVPKTTAPDPHKESQGVRRRLVDE